MINMTRPYQRLGSEKLEQMFIDAKDDWAQLKKIEAEFKLRSVPIAMRLLETVQKQQAKVLFAQKAIPEYKQPFADSDLFGGEEQLVIPIAKNIAQHKLIQKQDSIELEIPRFTSNLISQEPQVTVFVPTTKQKIYASDASGVSVVDISVEQAYRILKVSLTASWETIEASRRNLVGRSQPDKVAGMTPDKRKVLYDECRAVNAAYRVLADANNKL
jgi:DnaJ-domain-containing protein 1